jgi:hypothetical protein
VRCLLVEGLDHFKLFNQRSRHWGIGWCKLLKKLEWKKGCEKGILLIITIIWKICALIMGNIINNWFGFFGRYSHSHESLERVFWASEPCFLFPSRSWLNP